MELSQVFILLVLVWITNFKIMNITNVEKFKMYHPDGTEDTAITWVRITSSDGDSCSTGYPNGRYDTEVKAWIDAGNSITDLK